MTDSVVKVGDVVAWMDVPSNTMVFINSDYYVHYHPNGHIMGLRDEPESWDSWEEMGGDADGFDWQVDGPYRGEDKVRVVAIDLTMCETGDELRALAEAFHRDHPAA